MGTTGYSGIQDEFFRGRGIVSIAKENQGELRGVRGAMVASSLRHHMERAHGIVLSQNRGVDVNGGGPDTYVVSFLWVLELVAYLVDGCPERVNNPGRLREHFMYLHWKSKVVIIQEVPELLPQCNHCGIHMAAAQLV